MKLLIHSLVFLSCTAIQAGNFGVIIKTDTEYSSDEESFASIESSGSSLESSEETFEDLFLDGLCRLDLGIETNFIGALKFEDYADNKRLFEDSLYAAVKKLKIKRIEKLLALGIPADVVIEKTTMLCYLCQGDLANETVEQAIRLFLHNGANLHQIYKNHETLLQYARRKDKNLAVILEEFTVPEAVSDTDSIESDTQSLVLDADELAKTGFLGDFLENGSDCSSPSSEHSDTHAQKDSAPKMACFSKSKLGVVASLICFGAIWYGYSYHTKSKERSAK